MKNRAAKLGAILALAALVIAPSAAWAEEVETGGGLEPEVYGLSDGVVNPGLEDLGLGDEE